MSRLFLLLSAFALWFPRLYLFTSPPNSIQWRGEDEDDCYLLTKTLARLRSGPSVEHFGIVARIPYGTYLVPEGRNVDYTWYKVYYEYDDIAGWIAAEDVNAAAACASLATLAEPDLPADFVALMEAPILPTVGAHVRDIFARGQAEASPLDPHVFAQVGDCNTESVFYLYPFDQDRYDLGSHAELEAAVAFFAGAFGELGAASHAGNTSATVLDPAFADPALCARGETPLACEYRRLRPAVALIALGANDTRHLTPEAFAANLRQIIEATLEANIIPVLFTFSETTNDWWEKTLAMNRHIVELACEYDVPLVHFWRAARALPDFGVITRSNMLTYAWDGGSARVDLDEAKETGHTLRNLLTLQTLDRLRREVLDTDIATGAEPGR